MNKYNTPIAKLGKKVLIAQQSDIPKIGTNEALEVLVEQWDLEIGGLEGEYRLEQLLRFNPWEDVTDSNEVKDIIMKINNFREDGEQNREIKIH